MKPCELPMSPCRTLVKAQLIPADPTSSAQGRPRWLLWGEDDDGGFIGLLVYGVLIFFPSNFLPVFGTSFWSLLDHC